MDWHKGGSTISDKAWEAVNENGASGVLESKVSVPADWWVQIGRTWGWVSKVLGTWDDKLSEFYIKKRIYTNKIRSSQAMSSGWNRKRKVHAQERQHDEIRSGLVRQFLCKAYSDD
jgi:hypothetical protein